MIGLKARGQELCTEHIQMLLDLHDLRLHVQVVYRSHHWASCGYVKGGILYYLELANICGGYFWEPDWGGVTKKGVNKGFIGCNEGLSAGPMWCQ